MLDLQKRLWQTELEILDEINRVCAENGLRYSLAYGTLLGAVRHKGFIPWDDDIDIMMPREDYDTLLRIWGAQANPEFILQDPYTCPDTVNTFSKIRKDRTTFIQCDFEKQQAYHKGIFVDIFPLDRVAPSAWTQKVQKGYCILALLYNRGYVDESHRLLTIAQKALLSIVPKQSYRKVEKWAETRARRWNYDKSLPYFGAPTVKDIRHHYSGSIFDSLIELEFEGKYYPAFEAYDQMLRGEYGDYMQLPPEAERVWKHHPLLIDFEHNYEELRCGVHTDDTRVDY